MSESLLNAINAICDFSTFELSTIKPSLWVEQNRIMGSDESRKKGRFSYDQTPYAREIVDCLSAFHPARKVIVMKGAQVGLSAGVIEGGIPYIISQNPCNIMMLTGHSDLSDEAVEKVDKAINSCGLRHLIRANVQRARANKTGDTNKKKEFAGGSLVSGSATNHKLMMQRSIKVGFFDDYDAAPQMSKSDGSTTKLLLQRFAAYQDVMKAYFISTPRISETSNINPLYLSGDQRRYHVPCPCCGHLIILEWSIDLQDSSDKAGITYKLDDDGHLIEDSVGYVCQSCGGFFDDSCKDDILKLGQWIPTATPVEPTTYSYHISSLYAPLWMKRWKDYVVDYLEANPPNLPRREHLHKTFLNLALGLPYENESKELKANQLQENIRPYDIGTIPEKMSLKDGNGKIVMITCAADMNGKEEDSRLDWEIVAWSESGASYSIEHGSIGTFVPRENSKKFKEDRERWTYEHHRGNSVWGEFEQISGRVYVTDTGRKMKVFITGLDTGHFTKNAYEAIDRSNSFMVGLKGVDVNKYIRVDADTTTFRPAKERNKLYLVEVNRVKDKLAELMQLKWDKGNDEEQPVGFMNYPTPSNGLYLYNGFFNHYEAEKRTIDDKGGYPVYRWTKKDSVVQNHFFDCRIYNHVVKDIFVDMVCREAKIKNATWDDYVNIVIPKK
jgi:phage terminase large subunit GpA-like protein